MEYLFPFEMIKPSDKILIYGYGNVGKSYVKQIRLTNYCEIIAIVDQLAECIEVSGYRLIKVWDIVKEEFDKIVVALNNETNISDVMNVLVDMGIEQGKIIASCKKIFNDEEAPYIIKSKLIDNVIHIGIKGSGGMGDVILNLPLIRKIKEMHGSKVKITYITKYAKLLDYVSFVENSFTKCDESSFDILMKNHQIPLIIYWDPVKIERITPLLYRYLLSISRVERKYNKNFSSDILWHYARVLNRNRINVCDIYDVLNLEENDEPLFTIPEDDAKVLKKFGLFKMRYLLLNRDVDIASDMHNFKLWPEECYNKLIYMLKKKFINLKLVRVGTRFGADKIINVDIDLCGKTDVDELIVLLKNSKLLISSEGGLVHLNHFLGGKSAVIYGPTDEKYFGYKGDIICVNRLPCKMPCQYISPNGPCPIKIDGPRCMKNITPEYVYEKIAPYLMK